MQLFRDHHLQMQEKILEEQLLVVRTMIKNKVNPFDYQEQSGPVKARQPNQS